MLFQLLVASARNCIEICTPYFVPDHSMRLELVRAAQRGVSVRIIVPGPFNNHRGVRWTSRRLYGELLRNGIEIYEYQPTMTHAKIALIDGLWSVLGSTNFDNRSMRLNDEATLNVLDAEFAAAQEAAFEADLAGFADLAVIQSELEAELVRSRTAESRRTAVLQELGAEREAITRIEHSADAAELRQHKADRIAELQDLAESWSVTTIALALLRRTRARYEKEHRPQVLSVAEGLLATWTDGRYVRILAPMGKQVQELQRSDGVNVPLAALSTGTEQQLYLALRFGLLEHFAGQAESLPVVMDDILVNFDPVRAERAARSIEDLATRHQVLYFTCHPGTPLAADRTIDLPALLRG